jgi:hypothetical protein
MQSLMLRDGCNQSRRPGCFRNGRPLTHGNVSPVLEDEYAPARPQFETICVSESMLTKSGQENAH